jgi:prophage antirepressor-like protein
MHLLVIPNQLNRLAIHLHAMKEAHPMSEKLSLKARRMMWCIQSNCYMYCNTSSSETFRRALKYGLLKTWQKQALSISKTRNFTKRSGGVFEFLFCQMVRTFSFFHYFGAVMIILSDYGLD